MKAAAEKLLSLVLCAAMLFFIAVPTAHAESGNRIDTLINEIIEFKLNEAGAGSVQQLIDGELTKCAGTTAEWYILALRQYKSGYNFSKYAAALQRYLDKNEVGSPVTRERYALMLIAVGYPSAYITETPDAAIGELGIMSRVFGLHLLNNGCKSAKYTASKLVGELLELQLSDGGWAIGGSTSEIDTTAMTLQALAPYYSASSKVRTVADAALSMLSQRQNADGDFTSYGAANPESTAQVIIALSALGINPFSDSRFIKNGSTTLDGLLKYRLSDGSFCHRAGDSYNHTATFQALCALVAAYRQTHSLGSFYIIPASERPEMTAAETTTRKTETTTRKAETTTRKTETTTRKAETTTRKAETTTRKTETTTRKAEATTRKTEMTTRKAETTTVKAETTTVKTETTTLAETAAQVGQLSTAAASGQTAAHALSNVNEATTESRQASKTDTATATSTNGETGGGSKKWIAVGICSAFVAACAVLWLCIKRRRAVLP